LSRQEEDFLQGLKTGRNGGEERKEEEKEDVFFF
jgi:hypothetical protein